MAAQTNFNYDNTPSNECPAGFPPAIWSLLTADQQINGMAQLWDFSNVDPKSIAQDGTGVPAAIAGIDTAKNIWDLIDADMQLSILSRQNLKSTDPTSNQNYQKAMDYIIQTLASDKNISALIATIDNNVNALAQFGASPQEIKITVDIGGTSAIKMGTDPASIFTKESAIQRLEALKKQLQNLATSKTVQEDCMSLQMGTVMPSSISTPRGWRQIMKNFMDSLNAIESSNGSADSINAGIKKLDQAIFYLKK